MWRTILHKFAPPPTQTNKINKPCKKRVMISQPMEKRIQIDREVSEFEIQTMFSASVMTFSMFMLITKRGDPGVYLPLITSILGYWSPAPKKDDK